MPLNGFPRPFFGHHFQLRVRITLWFASIDVNLMCVTELRKRVFFFYHLTRNLFRSFSRVRRLFQFVITGIVSFVQVTRFVLPQQVTRRIFGTNSGVIGMNRIPVRIAIVVGLGDFPLTGLVNGFRVHRIKTTRESVSNGRARPYHQSTVRVTVYMDRRFIKLLHHYVRASKVISVVHHQGEHLLLVTVSQEAKDGRRVECLVVATNFRSVGRASSIKVSVKAKVISTMARSNLNYRICGGVQLRQHRGVVRSFFVDRIPFSRDRYQRLT